MINKFKLVAPDGGWGYIIIFAITINLSITTSFRYTYGMVYKEYMEKVGMTSTQFTTTMGIFGTSLSLAGFVTHNLLSIMSIRKLYFLAVLIYNAGVFGGAFVTSIFSFHICLGLLQGIGFGIIYNLSFTALNEYFVNRRLLATSISQTSIAIITMVLPIFIKWSLEEYGYRGTLLLTSGIVLNNLIGVALIQPVKWHMKKVRMLDCEAEKKDLLDEHSKKKILSFKENTNKSFFRKVINFFVDESIRKTYLRSCIPYGASFCLFAEFTYTLLLPQAFYAAKWNQHNVSLALSFLGFGDLAMRIILILGSSWIKRIDSEKVYVAGITLGLMARLGTIWSKNVIPNLIFIVLTGMSNCLGGVLITIVIADNVQPEQFTAAMGIFLLTYGIFAITLGPAIGAVRDYSNSYIVSFYVMASCFAILIIVWSIELYYNKNKRIKQTQRSGL